MYKVMVTVLYANGGGEIKKTHGFLCTGFRLTFILSLITTKGLMVGFVVFSPGSKICSYLYSPLLSSQPF